MASKPKGRAKWQPRIASIASNRGTCTRTAPAKNKCDRQRPLAPRPHPNPIYRNNRKSGYLLVEVVELIVLVELLLFLCFFALVVVELIVLVVEVF